MRLHFAQIIAELIQAVACSRKFKGGQDRVVDSLGRPPADRSAAMQQNLHEPDHARVVDLDARKLRGSHRDGQRESLQKRELDVNVQALRLESDEAVSDRQEFFAHGGQVVQALPQSEVGQIIGADLISQEGGELLVLLHEGVFEIGAKDVMPVLDLLQRGVEFSLQF